MPFFCFFAVLFTLTFKGMLHFFVGRNFSSRTLSRICGRAKKTVSWFKFFVFFSILTFLKGIFSIFSCVHQIDFHVRELLKFPWGERELRDVSHRFYEFFQG